MIFTDGFDADDKAYLETWPELDDKAAMIESMTVVIGYVDHDGASGWRSHHTSGQSLTSMLGLLELAKLKLIADTDCGLPISYSEGES